LLPATHEAWQAYERFAIVFFCFFHSESILDLLGLYLNKMNIFLVKIDLATLFLLKAILLIFLGTFSPISVKPFT
jgi:hypothetical protein